MHVWRADHSIARVLQFQRTAFDGCAHGTATDAVLTSFDEGHVRRALVLIAADSMRCHVMHTQYIRYFHRNNPLVPQHNPIVY